jgi:hypothetical protein
MIASKLSRKMLLAILNFTLALCSRKHWQVRNLPPFGVMRKSVILTNKWQNTTKCWHILNWDHTTFTQWLPQGMWDLNMSPKIQEVGLMGGLIVLQKGLWKGFPSHSSGCEGSAFILSYPSTIWRYSKRTHTRCWHLNHVLVSIQNCERINICFYKSPSLWCYDIVVQDRQRH